MNLDLSSYDAIILDLWGVVHDGTALYPQALASLRHLKALGKPVALLSNAPRQAIKAREVLDRLGVTPDLYAALLTSGQVAHDTLACDTGWLGTRYYYLGPGKDEDILADLSTYRSVGIAEAEFVLNTGFEEDFQPPQEILPTLEKLRVRDLPLLCVNPDFEVVKLDGTFMLCAGEVARMYAALGGRVEYIGKPHRRVYEAALAALGHPQRTRVLAIGDGPATDILGANRAGIDSLLITGGILSRLEEEAGAVCARFGAAPTYSVPIFDLCGA